MIMTPTQATLLGMPGTVLFALVLLSALAFFAYTMSRRIQLLTLGAGAPDDRLDRPCDRFVHVLTYGLFQKKMFRDPYAGLYHALIFGGFIVLTVRTLSLVFEGLFPQAGLPFFPAGFWEGYLLLKDVTLVTTLAGVVLALGRRHVFRKARLDPSFDADLILLLIGFLMVTDLAAGAARFALETAKTGAAANAMWEPLTFFLSRQMTSLSPSSLQATYFGAWWGHLVAILVFGTTCRSRSTSTSPRSRTSTSRSSTRPERWRRSTSEGGRDRHFGRPHRGLQLEAELDFMTCTGAGAAAKSARRT